MRLLNSKSLKLQQFFDGNGVPKYAILSHTWGEEEFLFTDVTNGTGKGKIGLTKVIKCCEQAVKQGYDWVWVDTCCIDKSSSAELTESINSMYYWYKTASVCYAYLEDVPGGKSQDQFTRAFGSSRWFKRGWTLQELIAPGNVEFYAADWSFLGTKLALQELVSTITTIDNGVLRGAEPATCNVAQRMSWASSRDTTRIEDKAYCLLGLFNVNMPLLYGEKEKAFMRLQEEILKTTEDYTLFAWHDHATFGALSSISSIYDTVLAHSPANFCGRGCNLCPERRWSYSELKLVEEGNLGKGEAPALTGSRGLRLDLPARHEGHSNAGDLWVYLFCEVGSHRDRLCLVLQAIEAIGSQYKRIGLKQIPQEEFHGFKNCIVHIIACPIRNFNDRYVKSDLRHHDSIETLSEASWESASESSVSGKEMSTLRDTTFSKQSSTRKPESPKEKRSPEERLMAGAESGNINEVREALESVDVNRKVSGWTALSKAAEDGRISVVQFLLDHGANPDITMDVGWGIMPGGGTALNWAAANGHIEIVKLLHQRGAKLDVYAPFSTWFKIGGTPITMAAGNGRKDTVKYLLEIGADNGSREGIPGWDAFLWACEKGQDEVVRYFVLNQHFDVEKRNISKMVPLHFAAKGGKCTTMDFLVQQGAQLMSKDKNEWTALHFAANEGELRAVIWLRQKGAGIQAVDKSGRTAADIAKKKDHERIVKYLRSGSADLPAELADDKGVCAVM